MQNFAKMGKTRNGKRVHDWNSGIIQVKGKMQSYHKNEMTELYEEVKKNLEKKKWDV